MSYEWNTRWTQTAIPGFEGKTINELYIAVEDPQHRCALVFRGTVAHQNNLTNTSVITSKIGLYSCYNLVLTNVPILQQDSDGLLRLIKMTHFDIPLICFRNHKLGLSLCISIHILQWENIIKMSVFLPSSDTIVYCSKNHQVKNVLSDVIAFYWRQLC